MCYVFLTNDLLSPQPLQKPYSGKIFKSTQNTFFTSFVACKSGSRWQKEVSVLWVI